jgi:hypothetical protein
MTASDTPVAPSLFDLVMTYSREFASGRIDPAKPLKQTAPIIVFCQNFYIQFFQNVLNTSIVAVDDQSKRTAARLAVAREKAGEAAEVLALIAWFEKFCDLWRDVLALGYGLSPGPFFIDFHESYVKRLLDRADAWAQTTSFEELKEASSKAREAYKTAVIRV